MAPLGAGGMGEVYRARDPRLRRDVALKILPEAVAADPGRIARFEREARLVAALDHPNVLVVFDTGTDPVPFVAFELLEGRTLEVGAALDVARAIDYATQIARGLAAAHARGVVHRDIKPGNVFVTAAGRVKILDFGIATAAAPEPGIDGATLTAAGHALGTPGYMAPEQARGEAVDARADVFSLGVVLYELLSGRRAFPGDTPAEAMAAVLRDRPTDLASVNPAISRAIVRVVRRCLEPRPESRFQSAADVAFALEAVSDSEPAVESPTAPVRRHWPFAAAVVAGLALLSAQRWAPAARESRPSVASDRFVINLPEDLPFAPNVYVPFALSPDGRTLAYTTPQPERLVLRKLDRFEGTEVKGADFVFDPFFSPDGSWVGFWTHGDIRKVALAGGAPLTVGPADDMLGASWAGDDTIVYAPGRDGLYRIPAAGGEARAFTRLDRARHETHHGFPQVVADGRAVLFTVAAAPGRDTVYSVEAVDLASGTRHTIIPDGRYGRYLPSGHLVFQRDHTLLAVRFDPATLTTTGNPIAVLGDVASTTSGAAAWTASGTGTLVYQPHRTPVPRSLVWVHRDGTIEPTDLPPQLFRVPRIGPDGRTMVVNVEDGDDLDVWTAVLGRTPLQRLTSGRRLGMMFSKLAISPNSREVAYAEGTADGGRIMVRRIDNGSEPREVAHSTHSFSAARLLRDGTLLMNEVVPGTGANILLQPPGGTARVLVGDPGNQWGATLSPDERYMAYVSDETGRYEIYVAPVDGSRPKQQVTTGGAAEVIWSRDGRELYYRGNGSMWAIPITTAPLAVGPPHELFDDRFEMDSVGLPNYDVGPDGRFLMLRSTRPVAKPELRVVLHWFDELRRLAP
ncbi:MAG: protein kinase [Vicinamibacterales bacterium]